MALPRSDDSPRAFHLIEDRLNSVVCASADIRTHPRTHDHMLPSFTPVASELTAEYALHVIDYTLPHHPPPPFIHLPNVVNTTHSYSYALLGMVPVLSTCIISTPNQFAAILMVACGGIPGHPFLFPTHSSKLVSYI